MNTDYLDGRREELINLNSAQLAEELRKKADEAADISRLEVYLMEYENHPLRGVVKEAATTEESAPAGDTRPMSTTSTVVRMSAGNRHERRTRAALARRKA